MEPTGSSSLPSRTERAKRPTMRVSRRMRATVKRSSSTSSCRPDMRSGRSRSAGVTFSETSMIW